MRINVAEWPPLGKELLSRLNITFDLFIYVSCSFGCFPFWFRVQKIGSDCASS